MKNQNVLIIEDEIKVSSFIKKGLEEQGFLVDVSYDGTLGLQMALSYQYCMLIVDLNLPGMNGYEVCKEIRKTDQKVPILILTALGTTENKITAFDIGADDYIVKPFEFRELVARIRALLKRSQMSSLTSNSMTVADLSINIDSRTVRRAGKKIDLTAKEFALLEYLIRNKGRVISRSELAEKIWDITFDTGTNVIDVYVNFLRKKIDHGFAIKLIHTHIGAGYVLKEEDPE
ncbi:MAG: DNA-binding response regulator [Bacteroidetes bacterium HGW-Bacteroidetes-21]|jgi:DNA-binding response OmpR family regulator|nr:MAG: DNA-binding response regulator [Bacteroidetes bacterium HGW-Bacteroidetes-21]